MQTPRKVGDWPKDDLEAVLNAEKVGQFTVEGYSFGTAHAMATGCYFGPDRCLAVGLMTPYLSYELTEEMNMPDNSKMLPSIASCSLCNSNTNDATHPATLPLLACRNPRRHSWHCRSASVLP